MDRLRYKCIQNPCASCPLTELLGGERLDADQAVQSAVDAKGDGLLGAEPNDVARLAEAATIPWQQELSPQGIAAVAGSLALVAAGDCR